MRRLRVFVRSFGCTANLADGEVLKGCLAQAGYRIEDCIETADIVVYNTCAVKGPTENRILNVLKQVPPGKRLVIAGCLPLINYQRLCEEVPFFDGVVGPAAAQGIIDVVEQVSNGRKTVALEQAAEAMPSLVLPRVRLNALVGIVPINYGCLGQCAYCCVVFARGRLRSYSIHKIVERVEKDLSSGVQELWVTSQDTACYGIDLGTDLAVLLKALCKVEGDFRIRVGMMTPNMAENILEDLIQTYKSRKIFKFIHLPVQSGDDVVLKSMHRPYSADDFRLVVDSFRDSFPRITLATDIICGFPGETREAFERSLRLIEEIKPDIVNISKFFPRPRTSAATMTKDFVPTSEIKDRSRAMTKLARRVSSERNRRWLGWTGRVLVDEAGTIPGSWIGRNFAYKPVVIKKNSRQDLIGETLRVKVIRVYRTYLQATLVG